MRQEVAQYFDNLKSVIASLKIEEIVLTMEAIEQAFYRNANIYIFGNGGSAAIASHFVCDFNKGMCENLEMKFRVICLNDNIPIITAIANDYSYEDIFYRQLVGKLLPSDLVIAISGSGNSKNIIKAVDYAKQISCKVLGITGFDGGELYQKSDYNLHVPVKDMQMTEDIHIIFDHMIMRVLGDKLAQDCITNGRRSK